MASRDVDAPRSDDAPGALTHGVAAAVGAGFGVAVGGPSGAIVGAAIEPGLAMLLHRVIQELSGLRSASAAQMLGGAARRLGRAPVDMIEDALSQPRHAQLLGEAVQAAARTVNEQKLRALSRALANGLSHDETRLDEEQLVLSALAEVDTPHIKLLIQLGPERSRSRTTSSNLRSRTAPSRGRTAASLANACNMSEPAARAALSVLQRAGLAARDESADVVRYDRLIMEIQGELNKLIELALKPPKDGRVPTSKRPRTLDRPGVPSRLGWVITPFGSHCLAYIEDYDETDLDRDESPNGSLRQPVDHDAGSPIHDE
jgi:hypothetical protein